MYVSPAYREALTLDYNGWNFSESSEPMVTVSQNVLAVMGAVIGSLLFMVTLNLVWRPEKRRTYNDLIGWQGSILGTTYAVILGFMLYTVWSIYREAVLNVDAEASAVVDVYRLADGIPEPQRTELKTLALSYADAVLKRDWPEMSKNEEPTQSTELSAGMWKTVISARPTSASEVTAQEDALSELTSLSQHRMTRLMESQTRLPNVLWCVLLAGGVLTIMATCTFSADSVKLQTLQIFSVTLLVSLALVAIADIHRPFHGLIHVSDNAFVRAVEGMQGR